MDDGSTTQTDRPATPKPSTDVAGFLRLLHPSGIYEIRILNCPERKRGQYRRTACGYFSDFEAAEKQVLAWSKYEPPGIYVTLNSVDPALLARSANKIEHGAKHTTTDADIVCRRHILIDLDPVKPAGTSATDAERDRVIQKTKAVRKWLIERGWPEPLRMASGNGAYLIYRVDMPNDGQATELVSAFLKAIADRFDDEYVTIDPSVFNASRILKIGGTWARKGSNLTGVDGIEDRPHRQSCFVAPAEFISVPTSAIEAVVEELRPASQGAFTPATPPDRRSRSPKLVERCQAYVDEILGAIEGQNGSGKTLEVGGTIARFGLDESDGWPIMLDFNRRCVPPWPENDLRRKLTEGIRKATEAGEWGKLAENGNGQHVAADATAKPTSAAATKYKSVEPGTMVKAGDRDNFGTVVSDDGATCSVRFVSPEGNEKTKTFGKAELSLQDGTPLVEAADNSPIPPVQASTLLFEHPELREIIIDGLARSGETVNIVSVTKIGKSWLAYLLILAIATGQKWLGTFDCKQGRCLLIDNELHVETLSRRLDTVAQAMGIPPYEWGDQIDIIPLRGKMMDLNALAPTIMAIEPGTYRCVLADAWYRFFPPGVDENSNAQVMQLYNQIDQYADHLQAMWVNIHHASKGDQSGKSVVDVGSGAGSQSRAADSHLILRPHAEDGVVVLEAAVRSFPPVDPIAIRWSYPCWSLAEDVDESQLRRPASPQDQRQKAKDAEGIAKIVAAMTGGDTLTCRQLRTKTGLSRERLDRLLHILESESRVTSQASDVKGNQTLVYELSKIEIESNEDDEENFLF